MENPGAGPMPDPVTARQLGDVARMVGEKKISKKMGKDLILEVLFREEERGADVAEVVERRGMVVVGDMGELQAMCKEIVEDPKWQATRESLAAAGADEKKRAKLVKFFFGKAMQKSKGQADVSMLQAALEKVCDDIK
jgi:aspartyl-tRNA(Asn)/glutamyl-tRNA(Gln) amidotransferase subunit B